ncbi:hypothetical protein MHYP_G00304300 [Metynnis hypsauchen]
MRTVWTGFWTENVLQSDRQCFSHIMCLRHLVSHVLHMFTNIQCCGFSHYLFTIHPVSCGHSETPRTSVLFSTVTPLWSSVITLRACLSDGDSFGVYQVSQNQSKEEGNKHENAATSGRGTLYENEEMIYFRDVKAMCHQAHYFWCCGSVCVLTYWR